MRAALGLVAKGSPENRRSLPDIRSPGCGKNSPGHWFFCYLLYDCAAEAMPYESHIIEAALLKVSDNCVHAVLMSDAVPQCL